MYGRAKLALLRQRLLHVGRSGALGTSDMSTSPCPSAAYTGPGRTWLSV